MTQQSSTHTFKFTLQTFAGDEYDFQVTGEFIPGAPAARDEYGRKTECDTSDDWELHEILVDGEDRIIDDAFASLFERYDYRKKGFVMMTANDLEEKIKEEMQYCLKFSAQYGDGNEMPLPF
jgi:hypothetical protein